MNIQVIKNLQQQICFEKTINNVKLVIFSEKN